MFGITLVALLCGSWVLKTPFLNVTPDLLRSLLLIHCFLVLSTFSTHKVSAGRHVRIESDRLECVLWLCHLSGV